MMREGGLPATDLFNRVRLRVNDATKGAAGAAGTHRSWKRRFTFFERAPDAPPAASFARTDFIDPIKAHP